MSFSFKRSNSITQQHSRNNLAFIPTATSRHYLGLSPNIQLWNSSIDHQTIDVFQLFSLQNILTDTNLVHKTLSELKVGKKIKCLRLGHYDITLLKSIDLNPSSNSSSNVSTPIKGNASSTNASPLTSNSNLMANHSINSISPNVVAASSTSPFTAAGGQLNFGANENSPQSTTSSGSKMFSLTQFLQKKKKFKEYYWILNENENVIEIKDSKKKKVKHSIFISDILRVEHPALASSAYSSSDHEPTDFTMTIIFSSNSKSKSKNFSLIHERIDLVIGTQTEFYVFLALINYLVCRSDMKTSKDPTSLQILKCWIGTEVDSDGNLDMKELTKLLNRINLEFPLKTLRQIYKQFDTDGTGYLEYDEFVELYHSLIRQEQVEEFIYRNYAKNRQLLFKEDFIQFLQDQYNGTTMLEIIDNTFIDTIFDRYNAKILDQKIGLACHDFTRFLLSSRDNCMINEEFKKLNYHDMNQPLTHYWISSSHNTYLTGLQWKGESSVEQYRDVLLTGCRCIELDCWDGPNEPIIYHGRTLTSKILFRDVIIMINQYAFAASEFPLILSLEVHCSEPQQEMMARIMSDIFGDTLLKTFFAPQQTEMEHLPSPNDLKFKIILKGKKHSNTNEPEEAGGEDSDDEPEDDTGNLSFEEMLTIDQPQIPKSPRSGSITISSADKSPINIKELKKKIPPKDVKRKVAQGLSDIIAWCGISFKGKLSYQCWHMHSFAEDKFIKVVRKDFKGLVEYNKNQSSRIYPKAMRVDSSNYCPNLAWVTGCQMAALNFQTNDEHWRFNEVKFQENGKCGYILKPNFLRSPEIPYPSEETHKPIYFTLVAICAQNLPKPSTYVSTNSSNIAREVSNPFVRIQIHGIAKDLFEERSETVIGNGLMPTFNKVFHFTIHCPEVAFLKVSIYDSRKSELKFICENYLPVQHLRQGFRSIQMLDQNLKPIEGCSLLCELRMDEKHHPMMVVPSSSMEYLGNDALRLPSMSQTLQNSNSNSPINIYNQLMLNNMNNQSIMSLSTNQSTSNMTSTVSGGFGSSSTATLITLNSGFNFDNVRSEISLEISEPAEDIPSSFTLAKRLSDCDLESLNR